MTFVQRARLPRTLAVIGVYLAFFTALVGAGFLLANPVADQAHVVRRRRPRPRRRRERRPGRRQALLRRQRDRRADRRPGPDARSQTLQDRCSRARARSSSFTGELLRDAGEVGFYLILVLVLSIYMLIYAPRIGDLVRSVMPPGDGTPEDDYPTRVQRAVSATSAASCCSA